MSNEDISRREFVGATIGAATPGATPADAAPLSSPPLGSYSLTIKSQPLELHPEGRLTPLDLLLGEYGAFSVLSGDRRINSCLTVAVTADGRHITSIEGLAKGDGPGEVRLRRVTARKALSEDAFAPQPNRAEPERQWFSVGPRTAGG
jgi:hypothetical protein